MKYLIGLHYESDDETNKAIRFAEQYLDLRHIGFELTNYYPEHRRNLLRMPIIGEIADELIPHREVFFLEDEKLVNEMRALETARAVQAGYITREKVESYLEQCKHAITPYTHPEYDYSYNKFFYQCNRTLEIIASGKNSEKLFSDINMERRAVIRDNLTKHSIEIAFVSFAHADKIAEGLSGYVVKDINRL